MPDTDESCYWFRDAPLSSLWKRMFAGDIRCDTRADVIRVAGRAHLTREATVKA